MKNKVLIVLVVVLTVMVILALYHAGVYPLRMQKGRNL